jgi:hypothetical protein
LRFLVVVGINIDVQKLRPTKPHRAPLMTRAFLFGLCCGMAIFALGSLWEIAGLGGGEARRSITYSPWAFTIPLAFAFLSAYFAGRAKQAPTSKSRWWGVLNWILGFLMAYSIAIFLVLAIGILVLLLT